MSELLKIGDVVAITTKEQPYMTVEYINDSHTDNETDEVKKYDSADKYDVGVVYFNGNILTRDRLKHGALIKIS